MAALLFLPAGHGSRGGRRRGRAGAQGPRVSTSGSAWCSTRGCRAGRVASSRPAPPCEGGDYSLCWSFTDGDISPGIHTGVSADVTGGYAELMPAHDSMLFGVPESIPDELAVFADPFSVSLHAITRHPPPRSGRVLVYGAGSLGLCAVAILRGAPPRRGGRGGRPLRGPGGAGPPVRGRHGAGARTPAGRHRGAGRLGRWPAAQAAAGPADGLPRCGRRRLRHRRQAGDVRGRGAGPAAAGDAGQGRCPRAGPVGVESAVLQGDQLGRLQRVRDRGGRRRSASTPSPTTSTWSRPAGSTCVPC